MARSKLTIAGAPVSKDLLATPLGRAFVRDQTVLAVLRDAHLCTEDGSKDIVDFDNRGRDCLDFTVVSRSRLQAMLRQAYDAGFSEGGSHANSQN